jgi:hypothetical protein
MIWIVKRDWKIQNFVTISLQNASKIDQKVEKGKLEKYANSMAEVLKNHTKSSGGLSQTGTRRAPGHSITVYFSST